MIFNTNIINYVKIRNNIKENKEILQRKVIILIKIGDFNKLKVVGKGKPGYYLNTTS